VVNALLPLPTSCEIVGGTFELRTGVGVAADGRGAEREGAWLRRRLEPLGAHRAVAAEAEIRLDLRADTGLPAEGYRLRVDGEGVRIEAGDAAGLHYGCRTLLQLLPDELFAGGWPGGAWRLPQLRIEDAPRFRWRGAMLDLSRHFQPLPFVERFIDLLAQHKLNTLHLHLTDDQGWRLEIARYPRLTEVGAWRPRTLIGHDRDRPRRYDDTPHGGFYTQAEIRGLVAYAAERHITLVPEIDMPGHMQAAIAAYPELGSTGLRLTPRCHWGISQHILNPEPATMDFLQGVLDEVIDLFPGPYIHLGGDEAVKHEWEEGRSAQLRMAALGLTDEEALQGWFMAQMAETVRAAGRRPLGWDEILDGGLPPDAVVMSWRGVEGALRAASLGHDSVVTPTSHTYFDYYQTEDVGTEPLAIGGHLPLERVYAFDPVPAELPPEQAHHILGSQGQLWSEYLPTGESVERMAFPRLCALAEVLWSAERDGLDPFLDRLGRHLPRLERQGVAYRPLDADGTVPEVGAGEAS
jgi:hexosaminidase